MPRDDQPPQGRRRLFAVWTIYDHPSDFPRNYVARMHIVFSDMTSEPTYELMVCPYLDPIQQQLHNAGWTQFPRKDGEDPCILEHWM